jgi:hypothetical protein
MTARWIRAFAIMVAVAGCGGSQRPAQPVASTDGADCAAACSYYADCLDDTERCIPTCQAMTADDRNEWLDELQTDYDCTSPLPRD